LIQTSLLMDHKIAQALDRIKAFEPPEGYYVATSYGKDSMVVQTLVEWSGVKADFHFQITGLDAPELIRFAKSVRKENHYWHKPEKTLWKLIVEKMMPPTRLVRYCCEELKERGGDNRIVVTGIRWEESNKRRSRKMVESCIKSRTKRYLHPIIDWSTHEVWEFIHANNVPYCSLYDEGFDRIGCIGCPMAGKKRLREFERWPGFERRYRAAMAAAAAANLAALGPEYGGRGRNAKLRWANGDDMFRWWIEETSHGKEDEAQCVLFE